MKKELTQSMQITKLRQAISILKQTKLIAKKFDSDFTGQRAQQIQQLIYSLRDIQYELRGIKQQISRSAQEYHLNINEIIEKLQFMQSEPSTSNTEYSSNMQKVLALLQTVQAFIHLKYSLQTVQAFIHLKYSLLNHKNHDLQVANQYLSELKEKNLPILTKEQYQIVFNALLKEIDLF